MMERNDKVRGGKVSDGKEASKRKKKDEKKVVSGRGGGRSSAPSRFGCCQRLLRFFIFFIFLGSLFPGQAGLYSVQSSYTQH